MPLYEYQCDECGGFSAWAAMADSARPAPCPVCGTTGPRVLSAVAMTGRRGTRGRGAEPRLVERRDEPRPASAPPDHAHTHAHASRPWMIGH